MEVPLEFIAQYKSMLGNHVVVRDPVGGSSPFSWLWVIMEVCSLMLWSSL